MGSGAQAFQFLGNERPAGGVHVIDNGFNKIQLQYLDEAEQVCEERIASYILGVGIIV